MNTLKKLKRFGQALSLLFFLGGVVAHIMDNYHFAYFLFFNALFVKMDDI